MSRPKCPNHAVQLEPTDQKRLWICPISDAEFECEVDSANSKKKVDLYGNIVTEWVVEGED